MKLQRLKISYLLRLPLSVSVKQREDILSCNQLATRRNTVTPTTDTTVNHVELTELTDLCSCDRKRGRSIDNDGVF